MKKYFGTDGIRRVANTGLTPELAYKVAKAGAYVLAKHASKEANPLYPVPVLWNAKELAPLYRQIKGE